MVCDGLRVWSMEPLTSPSRARARKTDRGEGDRQEPHRRGVPLLFGVLCTAGWHVAVQAGPGGQEAAQSDKGCLCVSQPELKSWLAKTTCWMW